MGMSDLNERLNQLEQGALNFLFPRRCPFCNQHIGNKELICAGCRKEAALHRGPGRPPDLLGPGGRASVLRGLRPRAILDFKFKGRMGGLPLLRQPDGPLRGGGVRRRVRRHHLGAGEPEAPAQAGL